MRRGLLTLLGLCVLVTAAAVPPPSSTLDPDDPSAGDPTSPPKSISFPTARASQPAIIPTQPSQCDGQNPSNDCLNALSGSGGYIWFDKDSECSNTQKSQLQTALWDATTLAFYSSNFPSSGEGNRGLQVGRFYMGPDFAQFQGRISGNLKRAWEFKTDKTSGKAYITTSCKDTKNICGKKIDGKAVGGYAWTINGWWGYYHYITLCQPFFSIETLDAKLADVEMELASGSTTMAQDMTWLRSTGQFFLHEMMHTRIADGGVEPHIIDEFVAPIPSGEKPGTNDIKAYGPRLVHKLAARSLNQGGGATRASTNADSYAILANAIWWWDTTGYFPGVPGKNNPATAQDDFDDADFPVSLYIDLGNDTDLATVDFNSLYSTDLTAFGDGPLDPDDQVSNNLAPAPTTSTLAPPPPPAPTDTCTVQYDVLFDHLDVWGRDFDSNKIGADGSQLKSSLKHCGDLTLFHFIPLSNDPNGWMWHAYGNLPIGTKSCVGSVMADLGGDKGACTGAG